MCKEIRLEAGAAHLVVPIDCLLDRDIRDVCQGQLWYRISAYQRTKPDIERYSRLLPLVQVSTLTTPDVQDLCTGRAGADGPRAEFADQDRLDPVVELFETDDWRVLARSDIGVGPRVVCIKISSHSLINRDKY